jgi:hypothetical protein
VVLALVDFLDLLPGDVAFAYACTILILACVALCADVIPALGATAGSRLGRLIQGRFGAMPAGESLEEGDQPERRAPGV